MHHKLKHYLTLIGFIIGFSTIGFAHEAPVVDVQQLDATASTQPVASSGSGWQPVNSNNSSTTDTQSQQSQSASPPPTQQWVSSQQNTTAPVTSSADPLDKRVGRLEQQMLNYTQMNLPQQVSDMQQKIATLQGQLEVDQRALKKLTDDQKTYYQDLQQQISQIKPDSSSAAKEEKKPPVSHDEQSAADTSTLVAKNNNDNDQLLAKNNDEQKNQVTPSASLAPKAGDAETYQKAFRLLSRKHFNQAHDAFKTYLQNYPNGQFAVNAYFWQGEIALMNQHYDTALKNFSTVVNQYPTSNKVADAKLKIAMIHAAKGDTDTAKKEFKQIRKDYPGSTAAQLASIRLQQISGGMIEQ